MNVIDSCLCYSLGFIDYIVLPTLTVLGDTVDLILSTFDIPHASKNKNTLPEEGSNENNQQKSSSSKVLFRPWTDILVENREKWQRKHDGGKLTAALTEQLLLTITIYAIRADTAGNLLLASPLGKSNKVLALSWFR